MADVQAVILAGGRGTRLRPITSELPKPLVPIANRPLVLHQLRHLAAHDVRDVTLALGYQADRFEGVVAEGEQLGLRVRVITEPAPLGTGGALRWCADAGAIDDERPLLWLNGDVVASPDVGALARFHAQHGALITLWLTSARDVTEFGVLELDSDGFVERFLEKPAPEETSSHLINAGIVLLDPAVLQRIPPDTFVSFEKDIMPGMVRERERLYGLFDGGYWLDIGRPRAYLAANRHVLEHRVPWRPRGERGDGNIWLGRDADVEHLGIIQPAALGDEVAVERGAQLFGRTTIGDRCRIGTKTRLENCVLFDDVHIGAEAEVVGSVICAGAQVEPGAIVMDSIVGPRAVVGRRNELRKTRLSADVALPTQAVVVDP